MVVTGSPPAFCVGGDRDALAGHAERGGYDAGLPAEPAQPGYGVRPEWDHDLAWHHALRLPVIAAVNGACAGIGLALALFCDLRFVSATAKLTTAAPKLGLPAEYGTSWMLPRLVGVTRAADLLLSGRVVTGAETEAWGLWNGVAADGAGALAAATADRPAAGDRGLAGQRGRDQAAAVRGPAAVRRRRRGRGLQAADGPDDGRRGLPRGRRRPAGAPPAELLTLRRRSPLRFGRLLLASLGNASGDAAVRRQTDHRVRHRPGEV